MKTLIYRVALSFLVAISLSEHLNAIDQLVSPLAHVGSNTARAGGTCALPTTRTLQSKRILDYLQQMIDYSRHCHRHDLVTLYEDSWLTAAEHIYGRLPLRFPMKGYPPGPASVTAPDSRAAGILSASPTPQWRLEMLSRPWRKIVARDGDYEVLECGHRCWHVHVPGLSKPRKRRCRECPPSEVLNKKPVESATKAKAKGATA